MNLTEYVRYDGLGLAELVAKRQVSAKELAATALRAIELANPVINAVSAYGPALLSPREILAARLVRFNLRMDF